jgi:RNA-binding protein NOB1
MQCVAILLGIRVMSPNGQRIAEVKRWLLRCAACGAETLDASKQFCPECGQHELIRYALVTRSGVERELPLPKRFEPTARGKKYSIPLSRPGKSGRTPLVLSEDVMMEANRKFVWTGGARARKREEEGFFEPRRKARVAPVFGYGKANPNVPNHLLGKKKKRNRD